MSENSCAKTKNLPDDGWQSPKKSPKDNQIQCQVRSGGFELQVFMPGRFGDDKMSSLIENAGVVRLCLCLSLSGGGYHQVWHRLDRAFLDQGLVNLCFLSGDQVGRSNRPWLVMPHSRQQPDMMSACRLHETLNRSSSHLLHINAWTLATPVNPDMLPTESNRSYSDPSPATLSTDYSTAYPIASEHSGFSLRPFIGK